MSSVVGSGCEACCGRSVGFEADLGLFVVEDRGRIYFARTRKEARVVCRALSILGDKALSDLRQAISSGRCVHDCLDLLEAVHGSPAVRH